MEFTEIMRDFSRLSKHWEYVIDSIFTEIGYEGVEHLFEPFYKYMLPQHDVLTAERFLQSIELIATKFKFYHSTFMDDANFNENLENYILDYVDLDKTSD